MYIWYLISTLMEKEMATHPNILAWRMPWTEKPGGLQSMCSQRVGHDWSDSISTEVLSRQLSGKEFACQCRRCRYDPWSGRSLGKRNATLHHLPWEIPKTEDNGGLQSMGSEKSWTGLSNRRQWNKPKSITPFFLLFNAKLNSSIGFSNEDLPLIF